jgi:hypothetical protein
MGIGLNSTRFLMKASREGCDFSRTLMLGRQRLSITPKQLGPLLSNYLGRAVTTADLKEIFASGYAEKLLAALGAATTDSLDFSAFEDATHIHDLNQPVPAAWEGRYTTVIDGGTLEHVFNVPVALSNAMKLTSVGGTLISMTVTNNMMGHGFYQFSPELFYRALSPENGFEMADLYLFEGNRPDWWYRVPDPDAVQRRVTLRNAGHTYIMARAKKVAEVEPFSAAVPQQSDYAAAWQGVTGAGDSFPRRVYRHLPAPLKTLAAAVAGPRLYSFYERGKPY